LAGGKILLFFSAQTNYEVHPAFYPVDMEALSPGIKWPGHEDDHSPPATTNIKYAWSYTSTDTFPNASSWCSGHITLLNFIFTSLSIIFITSKTV
jgi:hypothetical protein